MEESNQEKLVLFCKINGRPDPQFSHMVEKGFYCAGVKVGEQEAISKRGFLVLSEAEDAAARVWMIIFGRAGNSLGLSKTQEENITDSSQNSKEAKSKEVSVITVSNSALKVGKKQRRESVSAVFEVEDDPDVLLIVARKKREAEKLSVRTKVKTKGKKRESMVKMAEFSNSITSSDERLARLKSPKLEIHRNCDLSRRKSNYALEEGDDCDYLPSVDEILKIPERPDDGGKTMDEVLDDLDEEIAQRKKKHEEEMSGIDADIAAERQRQDERQERLKKNAILRDRLEVEVNEIVLRRMFRENIEYLKDIEAGRVESSRHKAFYKSCRTRHSLFYTMITDPFTDDQLEWTLEELGKVWMKTKREQMDMHEYVWKVILAEIFIKFYMDHFGLQKKEAEQRISETPLRKGTDYSSDDEL